MTWTSVASFFSSPTCNSRSSYSLMATYLSNHLISEQLLSVSKHDGIQMNAVTSSMKFKDATAQILQYSASSARKSEKMGHPALANSEFQIASKIGEGQVGLVYKCRWNWAGVVRLAVAGRVQRGGRRRLRLRTQVGEAHERHGWLAQWPGAAEVGGDHAGLRGPRRLG